MPTLSVKWLVNEPRLSNPTANEISVTFIGVVASMRFAWYMRTADRYRPGETPVASLKRREKWKRLSIALCAISFSERGSL